MEYYRVVSRNEKSISITTIQAEHIPTLEEVHEHCDIPLDHHILVEECNVTLSENAS